MTETRTQNCINCGNKPDNYIATGTVKHPDGHYIFAIFCNNACMAQAPEGRDEPTAFVYRDWCPNDGEVPDDEY